MQAQDAPTMFLFKIWPWFEANLKRIAIAAGVLAAVILAYSFFSYERQQKEILAGQAFTDLVISLSPNPDHVQLADKYLKLADQFAGTLAARRATLQGAVALFAAGKYSDAQTQFQKFLDAYPEDGAAPQAALGVAVSLESQNNFAAAGSAYQKVISQFPEDGAVLPAKLSLARLYQSQGKSSEARALYTEIIRSNPNSPLAADANLRLMELGTAPAPSTNAAALPAPSITKP
jgi:TolA-binding protein